MTADQLWATPEQLDRTVQARVRWQWQRRVWGLLDTLPTHQYAPFCPGFDVYQGA